MILLVTTTAISITGFALSADAMNEYHNSINYTVPVLTTETVKGNTIYSLEKSKQYWSKHFLSDPANLDNNIGIHYEWAEGAGNGVQNGIDTKFYFDGISIKLSNIGDSQDSGSRRFALVLAVKKTRLTATHQEYCA